MKKWLNGDLKNLQPTYVMDVPRVANALHAQFQAELRAACHTHGGGAASQKAFEELRTKYSQLAGTSLRQITVGGAKPSPDSMAWLRLVFGEERVAESYGISEVGGIADAGKILEGVEVKLRAWGEFSPSDSPPRGELLVRTQERVRGYVGQAETSRAAFDADGFCPVRVPACSLTFYLFAEDPYEARAREAFELFDSMLHARY